MDVRLSPEQETLRDSAAQIVDKLGPKAVGQLDDAERKARLDAAVDESGWRELRGPSEGGVPLASGVEPAIIAEELGRGLADVSFLGPTLAAELRRLAGAPPVSSDETVGLDAAWLIGRGPQCAAFEVTQKEVAAGVVACRIRTPARHRKIAPVTEA